LSNDGELHLLVAVVPVACGVVEGLAPVENLPRRLPGGDGAAEADQEKQDADGAGKHCAAAS